ncbi:MAG: serine/threonine protein kinase, partial [Chloroflexales bacterium]|nr:serine/threonine protein kinase [Chloroflexales bacterium]
MPLIKKVGTRGIAPLASTTQPDDGTRQIAPSQPPNDDTRHIAPGQAPDDGARQSILAQTIQKGSVLQGRYAVEGPLGVGGMSMVYRGRDLRFKDVVRPCAIKEMYQSAPDSNTRLLNLKNFEREAGLLATLHHPAIPKVYDFFEESGKIYLVLELVPGKDLETALEENGEPFDEARVVRWGAQICDVLSYLHTHQPDAIVFRDMKPSNVMVTDDERIVLIDFGIARNLNRTDRKGTMIGTEGYSPPEQYRGMAEPQGDLYALGATLHHLLSSSDPRLETPFTFHERPLR